MWRRGVRVAVTCLLAGYATVLLMGNPFLGERPPLADFGSLYASGLAASQGLDPYGVYPLTMNGAVNLNPPASLLLFAPLSRVDPYQARRAWFVATLLAVLATLVLLQARFPGPPYRLAWVVAATPFWETVGLGQIYALLALPSTLAWLLIERQPLLGGALIGLVAAIKPNFLVWPALLLVAGQWRSALAAASIALALNVAAALVFGPLVVVEWLAVLGLGAANSGPANGALAGLLARLGLSMTVAWVDLVGLVGLVGLAALVWLSKPEPRRVSSLALVGALVLSPLAWVGYGVFLVPLFFARAWTWPTVLSAALMLIPRLDAEGIASQSRLALLSVGSAYSVAWLILLSQQVRAMGVRWPSRSGRPKTSHLRGTPAPS